ncbi:MAG: enoyl-CoA hydratase [Rhizobiales bacterium]|nr:enoyl-CoA hydratase [Hyphomicrobiales bacterium]
MTPAILLSDVEDGVLRLILNDPASRNSLSEAMMDALEHALDDAETELAVRVIVIAANGPAFCSGHNLKEITAHRADGDRGRGYFGRLMERCSALMLKISGHPRPVIAEVQGIASAAGCQLVASCDLAIASDTARFCTPGVDIGLFCTTPMVALSRNVAPKHAMEMLLTGEPITATEAWRFGLVNRVVSPNELSGAVNDLAKQIASKSTLTVKTGKQAFQQQRGMGLEDAYAFASAVMTENLLAQDAEEGIGAFIDKRRPQWKDR